MRSLISTMAQYGGWCPLCGYPLELSSFDTVKHGHVALVSVGCVAGHSLRWNSSSIIGRKYTANLREKYKYLYFEILKFLKLTLV